RSDRSSSWRRRTASRRTRPQTASPSAASRTSARSSARGSDMMHALRTSDPDVFDAIVAEADRQHNTLELIASENFTSRAVLEAAGTVLTNKYAEGYPGKRYYGGCEYVDVIETLAIARAKELFG